MTLNELTAIPFTNRDQNWENKFFQALSLANLRLLTADPQTGPDGWPYLMAETGVDAKPETTAEPATEPKEPIQKVIQWLAGRGIGLVINPQKEYPDYVFTYGMLWNFRETGFFFQPLNDSHKEGTVEFTPNQVMNSGEPAAHYLPSYVRTILREFFRDQAILKPRVLVMSTNNIDYDLVFSLESLGTPPESEHAGIAEAIGWFLPPHYSILLISEVGLPSFFDL